MIIIDGHNNFVEQSVTFSSHSSMSQCLQCLQCALCLGDYALVVSMCPFYVRMKFSFK